jgi:trehalose 6-phosphate phosphatase
MVRHTSGPLTGSISDEELLAPLREHPDRSALVCDIDGTIAPIVTRPEEALVPEPTRELLTNLSRRYALVGCVSGRRAQDARRLVGIGSLAYIGNHGLEYLVPRAQRAEVVPALAPHASAVREFATAAYTPELRRAGIRLEDKESIWSFHWRQASDEASARELLDEVARSAAERGLVSHWGRKVLEIRPSLGIDKGTAVASVLRDAGVEAALYAGDDTTDLDAFRGLRELRRNGALRHAVCVGVSSDEGPAQITGEADLVVDGPSGFRELLAVLAS